MAMRKSALPLLITAAATHLSDNLVSPASVIAETLDTIADIKVPGKFRWDGNGQQP